MIEWLRTKAVSLINNLDITKFEVFYVALFSPYWTFLKIYFLRLGFLEGWLGFVIAKLYAQYIFWKYLK